MIDRLGYTPNAIARGLATRRSRLVGAVISDVKNPFYPELLEAIEDQLAEHGLKMILSNAANQPERFYTRLLVEHRVDGLIFTSARQDSETVRALAKQGFPLVLVNRFVDGVDCDSVTSDNAAGASASSRAIRTRARAATGSPVSPPRSRTQVSSSRRRTCARAATSTT